MDIEKVFRNHAFLFFRLARRSSVVLSALDYFEERFDLSELDKDAQEEYGDSWGGMVVDALDSMAPEERKLVRVAFVNPKSKGTGFRLGEVFRYDIIALGNTSYPPKELLLLQTPNAKGMSMERHMYKEALWFLLSAARSDKELSATEFFDKNVKLPRKVKKWKEEYREIWGDMLLEQINLLS